MTPSAHTTGIAAGAVLTGWLVAAPDTALQVWNLLPPEIVSLVPAEYSPVITGFLTLAVAVSKLIKSKKGS